MCVCREFLFKCHSHVAYADSAAMPVASFLASSAASSSSGSLQLDSAGSAAVKAATVSSGAELSSSQAAPGDRQAEPALVSSHRGEGAAAHSVRPSRRQAGRKLAGGKHAKLTRKARVLTNSAQVSSQDPCKMSLVFCVQLLWLNGFVHPKAAGRAQAGWAQACQARTQGQGAHQQRTGETASIAPKRCTL